MFFRRKKVVAELARLGRKNQDNHPPLPQKLSEFPLWNRLQKYGAATITCAPTASSNFSMSVHFMLLLVGWLKMASNVLRRLLLIKNMIEPQAARQGDICFTGIAAW